MISSLAYVQTLLTIGAFVLQVGSSKPQRVLAASRCELITVDECKDLPYNDTRLVFYRLFTTTINATLQPVNWRKQTHYAKWDRPIKSTTVARYRAFFSLDFVCRWNALASRLARISIFLLSIPMTSFCNSFLPKVHANYKIQV